LTQFDGARASPVLPSIGTLFLSISADESGVPRSEVVAIDPNSPSRPVAADLEPPIIDNELPAYRAVHPLAIVSLLFGAVAVLTYLSWYFAIFGAIAIVLGVLAQRNIRRLSDVYTGERMANAGIALGLLFSLSALTIGFVQGWMIERDAGRFAREYVKVLQQGTEADASYLESNPHAREGKTPQELYDQAKASAKGQMFDEQTRPVRDIKRRLSNPGQTVEFYGIMKHDSKDLQVYANAVLLFKGPKTQAFPEEIQYAEAVLHGLPKSGATYDWWIESLVFPVRGSRLGL
jgi:hypothetical protein